MTATAIIATVLRGVHVTALVSLFGTLLFIAVLVDEVRLRRVLRRVARISAVGALLAGLAWLVVESSVIAGADRRCGNTACRACGRVPNALRAVVCRSMRVADGCAAVADWKARGAFCGGGVGRGCAGDATSAWTCRGDWRCGRCGVDCIGSAAFVGGWRLARRIAAAVHRGAHAGARRWRTACRGFTPIGLAAVLLLAGTAVVQVVELMGGLPGLFGTSYGHVALAKLALFFVLLSLAALNRLVLTERLASDPSGAARWHMSWSILCEMVLGVAVIVAAGLLASLTPGTHEQPVWPLPWRPSMAALRTLLLPRRGLVLALVAAGVGIVVVAAGLIWWRYRREAYFSGVVILVLALPHLESAVHRGVSYEFLHLADRICGYRHRHGAKLFVANCAVCHGLDARGDGLAAKSLPVPPARLTAEHLWMHNDGELYWHVAHGLPTPDGGVAMPGFEGTLSSEAIWDLIDYLRAHNAGQNMRQTGTWSHPVPVPQFDAVCPDGRALDWMTCAGECCESLRPRMTNRPSPR